jgi:hypothetical protein
MMCLLCQKFDWSSRAQWLCHMEEILCYVLVTLTKKPLSLLQIYENPPISVFKWFQHLKIIRSHSLKKNQNKKTVDPNYFKNHKEPVIYRNEPIKNHQFNGQLLDFFNFMRIAIMYQNYSFDFSRTTAMYPKNYLGNYCSLFLFLITTQHLLKLESVLSSSWLLTLNP